MLALRCAGLARALVCALALPAFFVSGAAPAVADIAGSLGGHVTVDGALRAGVEVIVRGAAARLTAHTAADGTFRFPRVEFGTYAVSARIEGRAATSATVTVGTDAVVEVDLEIGAPREIGRARAAVRAPTRAASVTTFDRAAIETAPEAQSLNRLVATVPGIVRFAYDEPVAHGFHGIIYEVDGAPVPQTASTSFSEIVDPHTIDSIEVFTGGFPAEFGGQRQGAVVNIVTKREGDAPTGSQTLLSSGIGTYGTAQTALAQTFHRGNTSLFFSGNLQRTARGLDAPTRVAVHDAASVAGAFLRTLTRLSARDTLAFDYSAQSNSFRVPINPVAGELDAIVNLPGQDDVQREVGRFANLSYTHASADDRGFFQLVPWWRSTRSAYAGDLPADIAAVDTNPNNCAPASAPCPLAGLTQDRRATQFGVRAVFARSFGPHAMKAGLDGSIENFTSTETLALAGVAPFGDTVARRGTTFAAYLQDTWTPSARFTLQAGLRYDRSAGFTSGGALQPRIGATVQVAPQTRLHAYYGRTYAAPALEDTRRDAVVVGGGTANDALPVYDLKPEQDSSYEIGLTHALGNGFIVALDAWQRNVWNVLDTTQIYPTPIFATFNNAVGVAHGYDVRAERRTRTTAWSMSASFSNALAGGVSGSTFLFPPAALAGGALQPEDHDRGVTVNASFTKRFGADLRTYATIGTEYGTGYPVQFQDGAGRLPTHLTFNAAVGRAPGSHALGFRLSALNLTGHQYPIKVNNGFNTTQWAPGAHVLGQVLVAL